MRFVLSEETRDEAHGRAKARQVWYFEYGVEVVAVQSLTKKKDRWKE
jgi:hypothetical protein